MNNYFFSKISNINRKISIHYGKACERIASQSSEILAQLFPHNCPEEFRKRFNLMLYDIENTVKKSNGRLPTYIEGRNYITCVGYIKLLIEIEEFLEEVDMLKQ